MGVRNRLWEVDFARGFAVLLMLVFNWLFALHYFGLLSGFDTSQGFWWFFARITAGLFVFIAGISLHLSFNKSFGVRWFAKRALKLFSLGLLATFATLLFLKDGFVVFGILHFLGVATLLAFPLLRLNARIISVFAMAVLAAGFFLSQMSFGFPWLLWLGFVPSGFYSVDYFPLLPWFSLVLLGIAFGKKFYPASKRAFGISESGGKLAGVFCFLGRHSLAVYLLHQPFWIAVLYFSGLNPLGLPVIS
ncbi:MAG: heparan-alpha-glucosaminide N-acetyltransferase [Candidatus Micrarchaeota archaeon]